MARAIDIGRIAARLLRIPGVRYAFVVVVAFGAAPLLLKDRWGELGSIVAFLSLVAVSWLCGPGPASISSLALMLASRVEQLGVEALWSGYREQDAANLLIFTVIMTTVGAAGMLRRRSLNQVHQREAQLREQAKHKDQFLATLAHELRNPLAPLRTGVELLRMQVDGTPDPEVLASIQSMMHRQVEHMVRLVDDLLDIGRINTGKIELRSEPFILNEMLQDAMISARPHFVSAQHEMVVALANQEVWCHGDRARLLQVFSNLLNNAAKFTPPGGRIALEVAVGDRTAAVSISDNGIGLAPESVGRVFEMFVQIGDSLSREHHGLGIGLSLARSIVQMHGGAIVASSDGIGKGSRFTVQLPVL